MASSKPTTTYIFHVIGTLTWNHVRYAIESAAVQSFHWERFVLFNHSPMDSDLILAMCDEGGLLTHFDSVHVYDVPDSFPGVSIDWAEQMRGIAGTDRYFSHKADFYLGYGVMEAFDALPADSDWFVLFNKMDMKERATIEDFREFAEQGWWEIAKRPDVGRWPDEHMGKLAVAAAGHKDGDPNGPADPGWIDGVMHGYTDAIRACYRPGIDEQYQWWGVAWSIQDLANTVPFIRTADLWACHMWHYSPHRNDPAKIIPGEGF